MFKISILKNSGGLLGSAPSLPKAQVIEYQFLASSLFSLRMCSHPLKFCSNEFPCLRLCGELLGSPKHLCISIFSASSYETHSLGTVQSQFS